MRFLVFLYCFLLLVVGGPVNYFMFSGSLNSLSEGGGAGNYLLLALSILSISSIIATMIYLNKSQNGETKHIAVTAVWLAITGAIFSFYISKCLDHHGLPRGDRWIIIIPAIVLCLTVVFIVITILDYWKVWNKV